ncbi:PLP-dependent transferase [Ascobolus immersus RN42]|uniref:aromatic-amino-acid transaminase n=1 Tax=Ascobolus immersus RN42 TaxID=1160509 RepID=A0A3N4I5F2_ASCIM|nr:PLP-dependent transferase [Ascobolus immersus RN42]
MVAPPFPPTDVSLHAVTDTEAVPIADPSISLVEQIKLRRVKKGPFVAGIAAKTDSENFKDQEKNKDRPAAKRWGDLLTLESRSRKPSSLKAAAKFLAQEGLISLGGGLPSSDYFPFENIGAKVPTIGEFSEEETRVTGQEMTIGKHDVKEGKSVFDLSIALNYGQGTGSAQMLRWVTEHTEIVHDPPYKDWSCVLTPGSSYPLEQVYRMFGNRGDYVLYEEFTFATAVETAFPLGLRPCGVKVDAEGLLPSDLDEILSNWDEKARGAKKPVLLYTVPSGQNPTGATQSESRRREVYSVCQKHNLLIIEDEPYFFLQMDPYGETASAPTTNTEQFLKSLVPSLLSMDVDGRVIRLDSFSKVIAPGSRMGWVVASAEITERITRHNENSVQNPSGIAQVLMHRLLDETWGHEGYFEWLGYIRKEYTRRRNVILKACETYLAPLNGVATWVPPMAGMFLWIQIHPPAGCEDENDLQKIEQKIFDECINEKVLLTPGSWFMAEGKEQLKKNGKLFFRATYAAASEEAMVTAIERFSGALRSVFEIRG